MRGHYNSGLNSADEREWPHKWPRLGVPRSVAKAWERQLRQVVKGSQGGGWLLRAGRGGRTQLIRCWEDGSRSTGMVPLQWSPSNATRLAALVDRLARLIDEQGMQLQEAIELLRITKDDEAFEILQGRADWKLIAKRFQEERISSGEVAESTYRREGGLYVKRVTNMLTGSRQPKNGTEALRALVQAYPLPTGGAGRKRMVSYGAKFLNFAVDRCGAPERFRPPADRRYIEGQRTDRPQEGTPILDEQIIELLHSITNPQWRLSIGLAGIFGLRPFEIWNCKPEGCALRVKGVKRNRYGRSTDRLVHPLDPNNNVGMGKALLQELTKGGPNALPPITRDWGERLNHQLTRHIPAWSNIIVQALKTNDSRPTPYSLRHGYAWRGSQLYGLSPRILAALMGHTVAVHLKHYGQWANESEVMAAVKMATAKHLASE